MNSKDIGSILGYVLEALRLASELVQLIRKDELSPEDVAGLRAKFEESQRRRDEAISELERLLEE